MPERKKPTLTLVKKGRQRRKVDSTANITLSTAPADENAGTNYSPVGEGFNSESYMEGRLDLTRYLIKHPSATIYVRVSGDSMTDKGIYPGSILVVDRAVEPVHGNIVIARIKDELCVKQLHIENDRTLLVTTNPEYVAKDMTDESDWDLWGRAMFVISSL